MTGCAFRCASQGRRSRSAQSAGRLDERPIVGSASRSGASSSAILPDSGDDEHTIRGICGLTCGNADVSAKCEISGATTCLGRGFSVPGGRQRIWRAPLGTGVPSRCKTDVRPGRRTPGSPRRCLDQELAGAVGRRGRVPRRAQCLGRRRGGRDALVEGCRAASQEEHGWVPVARRSATRHPRRYDKTPCGATAAVRGRRLRVAE